MTKLESQKQIVNFSAENVFNLVSNATNLIKLLPAEKIENWTSTQNSCSFHIKGLTTLEIEIQEKTEFTIVKYKNSIEKPFAYEMHFLINKIDSETSETQIILNADLNMTLKFLVSTPLKNLLDIMNNNIKDAF
jgi:hypothetical protein